MMQRGDGAMAYEHEGHRQRFRSNMNRYGMSYLSDRHMLEYILYFCLPRRDTAVIVDRLLAKFGRLDILFNATAEELREVEGVGPEVSAFLNIIPQVCQRFVADKYSFSKITNSVTAAKYLMPLFMFEQHEIVYTLCLDKYGNVLGVHRMSYGLPQITTVNEEALVHFAVSKHAASIVLAHNHVGGSSLPSREDEIVTRDVAKKLRMLNISVLDHLVFSGSHYVSMLDSGFMLE